MGIPPRRELCIALMIPALCLWKYPCSGGFRNTRFFVALQASFGTGRRSIHEHSPEFHAKAMLAVHRSFGPAALVCKRAASARAVCVRMPVTRPKALFPKGYGAYFLAGQVKPAQCVAGQLEETIRFTLHSSRVCGLFSRENDLSS